MTFLDTYFDPTITIDPTTTPEIRVVTETARLQGIWSLATHALAVPRRVENAEREELALDKKRCRRVAWASSQSLGLWEAKPLAKPDPALLIAGSQIIWPQWWEEYRVAQAQRLRYHASWAKGTNQLQFGKKALQRLVQELDWYKYAMRD